jgi:LEA14-like dessication related protein
MIIRLAFAFMALSILSCAKPKDLEYVDFKNLKVLQWGLLESTVGMDIEFYNPNRYQIQVKKADVDVYINNSFLGKSTLDSLIRIPGKDTFMIPVLMRVQTTGAVANIIRLASDSAVMIKLEGHASFGRNGLFVNYPVKYEGLQRIKF